MKTPIVLFLLTVFLLPVWSLNVYGRANINTAYYDSNRDELDIQLDENVGSDARVMAVYVVDTKNQKLQSLTNWSYNPYGFIVEFHSPFSFIFGGLTPSQFLKVNLKYFETNPILITLIIKPSDVKSPIQAVSAKVNSTTTTPATPLKDKVASSRDDSEIYLSGDSITAVGSKPQFSVDVKYDRSRFVNKKYNVHFGPTLSYKGSTNPKADADQLLAGLGFFGNADPSEGPCKILCFTRWEAGARLEANRRFTVKNLLTNELARFYFHPLSVTHNKDDDVKREIRLQFAPFVGDEVGSSLSSPIKRSEKAIVRLLAGATVNMSFPSAGFLKWFHIQKGVLWENSFTQRWYLKPELAYDKDKDGNLILRDFGRKPHSYVFSKFTFLFSDYIAPTITYEWGDQPPLYNRLHHKVEVGLTFMLTTKYPN